MIERLGADGHFVWTWSEFRGLFSFVLNLIERRGADGLGVNFLGIRSWISMFCELRAVALDKY